MPEKGFVSQSPPFVLLGNSTGVSDARKKKIKKERVKTRANEEDKNVIIPKKQKNNVQKYLKRSSAIRFNKRSIKDCVILKREKY